MSERPKPTADILKPTEKLQLGREIIVLRGPQGAGKTTIREQLAAETGKPSITISNILRDMAENDQTELGDECRAMFREHRYANSQKLQRILVKEFKKEYLADGFILDGGMRTLDEAQGFQSVLEKTGKGDMPLTAVYLRVPMWMSFERLVTGENARHRDDDTVEGLLSRLSHHNKENGQITSFLRHHPTWESIIVNAMGTADQTYQNVRRSLRKAV